MGGGGEGRGLPSEGRGGSVADRCARAGCGERRPCPWGRGPRARAGCRDLFWGTPEGTENVRVRSGPNPREWKAVEVELEEEKRAPSGESGCESKGSR